MLARLHPVTADPSPPEWNAASYHRVSEPQTEWGRKVLSRLVLRGDERVIDAGCGTGRLTDELMRRLPSGHLVAVDRSRNMLVAATANVRPGPGSRASFVRVELPHLPFDGWADLVFSAATFHWVRDHDALFAGIWRALRPGGRLFAQCGGGPNLAHALGLAAQVMRAPRFASHFDGWAGAWQFSGADESAARLEAAGFVDVHTSLEQSPASFADEASYREFVTTVIYHPHLARLPEGAQRVEFIDEIAALAAESTPPFTLDYWRLNLDARRP